MGRLTATAVRGLRKRGRYSDGDGLALSVTTHNKRYWTFRWQRDGRERAMTFGNADKVSLADARAKAAQARALLARGIDPLEAKQQAKAKKAATVTFGEVVENTSKRIRQDGAATVRSMAGARVSWTMRCRCSVASRWARSASMTCCVR